MMEILEDLNYNEQGLLPAIVQDAETNEVLMMAYMNKDSLKEVEGLKAFFLNDPSKALNEIKELRQLDLDKSGSIDPFELEALQNKKIDLRFNDKLLELVSTHPNMLKRIKALSAVSG